MLKPAGVVLVAFALTVAPGRAIAQGTSDVPVATGDATVAPVDTSAPIGPTEPHKSFVKTLGGDLRRFLSRDNAHVALWFGSGALAATQWDHRLAERVREKPSWVFAGGNAGGTLWTELGAGLATFAVGKTTDRPQIATLGSELLRAQIVSQAFVQSLKLSTGRTRPDASNDRSLPSGHTASAFAMATVLERRLGWKAGIPAYAFGAYVATARIASSKHYMSDVIVGAALGVGAGRAVTFGAGRMRFDVGVAPAARGAVLTFTKRN